MTDVTGVLNLIVTAVPIVGAEVVQVEQLVLGLKDFLASKGYSSDTVAIQARIAKDARQAQALRDEEAAEAAKAAAPPVASGS
jgi:hypothetical protein